MIIFVNKNFYFYVFLFSLKLINCSVWQILSATESPNVKHLTHDVELQIYSQHTKHAVALFCSTQEIKCKNIYKEFVDASNELTEKEIAFLYIDTLLLPKTAENFDIKAIPKILTFRDYDPDKGYAFKEKYTKANIVDWFYRLPLPSIEIMLNTDVQKYIDIQKKKGYASLIAYGVKKSENVNKLSHFSEIHNIPNLSVGLVYIEEEKEMKIEIFNGPGSTKPDETNLLYKDIYKPDNNIWTSESIKQFAEKYMKQFPIIINYSRKRRKPKNNEIYFYIFTYYNTYSDELFLKLYNIIKENSNMTFVFPIEEEKEELIGESKNDNIICILDYTNATLDGVYNLLRPKKYVQFISDEIKEEIINNFINDFNNNKLNIYRKTEKEVKKKELIKYQILSASNFEKIVFDPQKIVIVFYHLKECKECIPLLSYWQKVASYFHLDYNDILVATLDAKLNDMIDEQIEFFPSVAIYPKGTNKLKRKKFLIFPIKIETLEDIIDEMKENQLDNEL